MNKEELKNKLIEQQEGMIAEFEQKVKDIHSMVDIDEEDTIDPEDFSHQAEAGEMEELIKSQLNRAKEKLGELKKFPIDEISEIRTGAIVETNERNFIVGFSIPPVAIEGKEFVGISKEAPIYSALEGKNVGDRFEVGGVTYEITKIY